jgi:hypothetical protein
MTLRQIDERPLTGRQKKIVSAAVLADVMEFYDFFLLASSSASSSRRGTSPTARPRC